MISKVGTTRVEKIAMTHYEMRRNDRQLSADEARDILSEAQYCTISSVDADGAPYGVPISFALVNETLYVHSTNDHGHKLDNFSRDARVCVSAVTSTQPAYVNSYFTTRYESAIAFGHIRKLEHGTEFRRALVALCMKYLPEHAKDIGPAIDAALSKTEVWAIDIEEISGKASR
ncbi:MAG: pyridoxamine 5'-phosphate oxidase family protein [Raoultibacter sp.]|jgi:nitroimidazol reductase NimA-like FMN-containing flavoprotein (pyridoxamine 5'-phosphate oxidase superfamily)